jgi:glycine cleavage system H lipoate-binding protein
VAAGEALVRVSSEKRTESFMVPGSGRITAVIETARVGGSSARWQT